MNVPVVADDPGLAGLLAASRKGGGYAAAVTDSALGRQS